MIYGLEEAKEWHEEDLKDAVQATFEKIGITPNPVFQSPGRLGLKKEGKSRLLKVKMMCAYQVERILK